MAPLQAENSPLALEPLDEPSVGEGAARSSGDGSAAAPPSQGDPRIATEDAFLAAAAREYDEGHVDQALWARASAQSGGERSLTTAAYLRARATVLQLQKRDRRLARRERGARLKPEARDRNVETELRPEVPVAGGVGGGLRALRSKPRYLAAAAAAVALVVAALGWLASPPASVSAARQRPSAAAPSTKAAPPAVRLGDAQTVVRHPSDADEGSSLPPVAATVQQLKDAGNWNVLVLYAAKWTRDEPDNPTAWKELSIGYANLHQFDDAAVAAEKAAALSPGEALLWRNLGHLNLTLDRLPDAERAFDRALTISADDADALCGAALVANRLGRTKNAEEIAKRVDPGHGRCPGLDEGESVTVVVRPVAAVGPGSKVRH